MWWVLLYMCGGWAFLLLEWKNVRKGFEASAKAQNFGFWTIVLSILLVGTVFSVIWLPTIIIVCVYQWLKRS